METKDAVVSSDELRRRTEGLARVRLAHLPTPFEEAPRFSEKLGGPRIFIKRDDCTGLAFGGNKTRHNEFLIGDALDQGVDLLICGAGVQSNNCRQTAAACAKVGLDCHLVLTRANHDEDVQGNLLLDHLVGASYEIVDAEMGPQLDGLILERAERFRAQGRKVYNWERKTTKPRAAISYALCMAEIVDQSKALGIEPTALYICAASATGAGAELGRKALGAPFKVHSVLPIHWPWDEPADFARIANEAAELLDLATRFAPGDIDVSADFVGPEYGAATPECMEAIALLARTEGILLDPSYSGKAMAALIDHVRKGRLTADDTVVFVHTGGLPALFAYRDQLVEMIAPKLRD